MTKSSHREFYSEEAEAYEETRYGSRYGRLFRGLQRSAVRSALVPAGRILDVATGTGQMLPVLASRDAFVVASDLTPAMLHEARRNIVGTEAVGFCVGDAGCLPYPDSTFDLVASSRFLHLFEARMQATFIREMVRVLRPGGTLLVDFYSADARWMFIVPIAIYRWLLKKRPENDYRVRIDEARAMVEASGLRIVQVVGLGNFILAAFTWLPRGWQLHCGQWLGRNLTRLSEQFLIVARKQ